MSRDPRYPRQPHPTGEAIPPDLELFELTGQLDFTNATAEILYWDADDSEYNSTGLEITVHSVKRFGGDAGGHWGLPTERGFCRFNPQATDGGRWEIVALFFNGLRWGKTDAAHAKNSDGQVSIWTGSPGAESDSGYNVEAYNLFGDVAINKRVAVALINGYWQIVAAECP